MSEVFKTRIVEAPQIPEISPQAPQPTKSDKLSGNEAKATDPITEDEKNLEVWEGLNRRKFVTDYFDIGNIDGEFNLKMDTAVIDKYIKQLIEEKGYEKNIDNYKSLLAEIENEIGSNRLEIFTRIKKLAGYAKVLNKINELKKKKKLYLPSDD